MQSTTSGVRHIGHARRIDPDALCGQLGDQRLHPFRAPPDDGEARLREHGMRSTEVVERLDSRAEHEHALVPGRRSAPGADARMCLTASSVVAGVRMAVSSLPSIMATGARRFRIEENVNALDLLQPPRRDWPGATVSALIPLYRRPEAGISRNSPSGAGLKSRGLSSSGSTPFRSACSRACDCRRPWSRRPHRGRIKVGKAHSRNPAGNGSVGSRKYWAVPVSHARPVTVGTTAGRPATSVSSIRRPIKREPM